VCPLIRHCDSAGFSRSPSLLRHTRSPPENHAALRPSITPSLSLARSPGRDRAGRPASLTHRHRATCARSLRSSHSIVRELLSRPPAPPGASTGVKKTLRARKSRRTRANRRYAAQFNPERRDTRLLPTTEREAVDGNSCAHACVTAHVRAAVCESDVIPQILSFFFLVCRMEPLVVYFLGTSIFEEYTPASHMSHKKFVVAM